MYAEGISIETLYKAASVYGFEVNATQQSKKIKFTLRRGSNEKYRHISKSWSGDRKTSSVCLHGHYRFFFECFKYSPNARFESSWYGKIVHTDDTLEENYDRMRDLQIGSQIYPVRLDECCNCGEAL